MDVTILGLLAATYPVGVAPHVARAISSVASIASELTDPVDGGICDDADDDEEEEDEESESIMSVATYRRERAANAVSTRCCTVFSQGRDNRP